jgi:hypothetical protein
VPSGLGEGRRSDNSSLESEDFLEIEDNKNLNYEVMNLNNKMQLGQHHFFK